MNSQFLGEAASLGHHPLCSFLIADTVSAALNYGCSYFLLEVFQSYVGLRGHFLNRSLSIHYYDVANDCYSVSSHHSDTTHSG